MSIAFDAFWNAYPKKVGKAAALKKWNTLKLDDLSGMIVAHLKTRVTEDKKWRDGFILDPATFLNQRRWEDEYERIQRKPPPSLMKPHVPEEYPQPCHWQASCNLILLLVLQKVGGVSSEILGKLTAMKVKAGERFRKQFGDNPVPDEDWKTLRRQCYDWMLKVAME